MAQNNNNNTQDLYASDEEIEGGVQSDDEIAPTSASAVCVYDFTLWIGEDDFVATLMATLVVFLKEYCKKWCFQEECVGDPLTDNHHFQGRFSLKVKRRFRELKQILNGSASLGTMHLSITSRANHGNMFYVMKPETRVGGPWKDDDIVIPKRYQGVTLRPWQQQVIDDIAGEENQTINILYDPLMEGLGKSFLMGYLRTRGLACCIPPVPSGKDVCQFVMSKPESTAYIIDVPKGSAQSAELYAGIESVKSGYVYDLRHRGRDLTFEKIPHVWIFANTLPNPFWIAMRKWKVWIVDYPEKKAIKVSTFTAAKAIVIPEERINHE